VSKLGNEFKTVLKAKRTKQKMSIKNLQCALARAGVDVTVQTIYNWEAGDGLPKIPAILKLNDILKYNFLECFP
jgi:predicted transcriptional regulator